MTVENIILTGCSFVHGDDVCYEKYGIPAYTGILDIYPTWNPSQKKYFEEVRLSGQLRKLLNCNVINLAESGDSNYTISSRLVNFLDKNKFNKEKTIVLVGWTENDRQDFYINDVGRLTLGVQRLEDYLNVFIKRYSLENKKGLLYQIDAIKKLLPYGKLYKDYTTMAYLTYRQHLQQIKLTELAIEAEGYKYIFWNSLPHHPLDPSCDVQEIKIENIKWKNWFPFFDVTSYQYSWDAEIRKSKLHTASYHPSERAITLFAKNLANEIQKKFKL